MFEPWVNVASRSRSDSVESATVNNPFHYFCSEFETFFCVFLWIKMFEHLENNHNSISSTIFAKTALTCFLVLAALLGGADRDLQVGGREQTVWGKTSGGSASGSVLPALLQGRVRTHSGGTGACLPAAGRCQHRWVKRSWRTITHVFLFLHLSPLFQFDVTPVFTCAVRNE